MGASLHDPGEEDDLAPMAEINVTPFVDVMLVLLIIFMVAAPLLVSGVPVDLPQSTTAKDRPPPKPLVVTITAERAVFLREVAIASADLTTALTQVRAQEGDVVAYIRADQAVAYGEVMRLLNQIAAAGFTKISLLTLPKPE